MAPLGEAHCKLHKKRVKVALSKVYMLRKLLILHFLGLQTYIPEMTHPIIKKERKINTKKNMAKQKITNKQLKYFASLIVVRFLNFIRTCNFEFSWKKLSFKWIIWNHSWIKFL